MDLPHKQQLSVPMMMTLLVLMKDDQLAELLAWHMLLIHQYVDLLVPMIMGLLVLMKDWHVSMICFSTSSCPLIWGRRRGDVTKIICIKVEFSWIWIAPAGFERSLKTTILISPPPGLSQFPCKFVIHILLIWYIDLKRRFSLVLQCFKKKQLILKFLNPKLRF